MNIGVVFPQTEFAADPVAIRDYAQAVEVLGFTHVLAYDHVLGADPQRPGGWSGPYTYQDSFFAPFLLFSHMAAVTQSTGFITGILILPQRQTALVAQQASTLDILCQGRFRLGVGLGWNQVEYIALNQDFHTRGRRVEEQVEVLRRLWTETLVDYKGEWHSIPQAGVNPPPVQRPIPVWFGGHADAVLRRIARMGDGWLPNYRRPDDAKQSLDKLAGYMEEAGRSMSDLGLEPRMVYGEGNPDVWHDLLNGWQSLGATHLSINTMGSGFKTPDEHIQALRTFAETIELS